MARNIQAIMLMRDRRIKQLSKTSSQNFFIFEEGLYMIPNDLVKVDELGIPRLYYFEGNPTPLTKKDKKGNYPDRSTDYLDEKIGENFLKGLNVIRRRSGAGWLAPILELMKNPAYVVFGVLALAVAYAFIVGGGVV